MYAIVEIGGHQYKVAENDVLFVDKQAANGDKLTFDRVLLVKDGNDVKIGTPVVAGAEVSATILDTVKADKVLVFKKKRRKGYEKLNGHRQVLSQIQIEGISLNGAPKKKAAAKPAATEEPKKATPKAESADLSSKTVAELKELAKAREISGYSSMKKAELIEALS